MTGCTGLTSDTVKTAAGATVASVGYGYNANDWVTSVTTSGLAASGGGRGKTAGGEARLALFISKRHTAADTLGGA